MVEGFNHKVKLIKRSSYGQMGASLVTSSADALQLKREGGRDAEKKSIAECPQRHASTIR